MTTEGHGIQGEGEVTGEGRTPGDGETTRDISELEAPRRVSGRIGRLRAPRFTAGDGFLVLVLYFGSQLVAGFVLGIVVGVALAVSGVESGELAARINEFVGPIGVGGVLFSGLVVLVWAMRRFRGRGGDVARKAIGWQTLSAVWLARAAVAGCIVAAGYLALLTWVWPPAGEGGGGPLSQMAMAPGWRRYLWVIMALLIAPLLEEFVFRGVMW